MRTGVYPFPSTNKIEQNLNTIRKAIAQAAENGVRLLAFHECALCGYPPVESNIEEITKDCIKAALSKLSEWAGLYHLFVAVGTVRFEGKKRFNSVILFNDQGKHADLCFVSFSDTGKTPSPDRYDRIKSHLITRASENVMPIVSVNSITNIQTAPTAIFDCNGHCVQEAERNTEGLLIYDFQKPERTFGMEGRIVNNQYFLKNDTPLW